MKKVLCLVMILAMAMAWGCAKKGPEDVAKDYVKKQLIANDSFKVNTSQLTYEAVEKDDGTAVVKVSGTIQFNSNILLVKENNKWIIADESAATAEPVIAH
jgi:hypothetical protein